MSTKKPTQSEQFADSSWKQATTKFKRVGLPGWLFSWIDFRNMPYRLQPNFYVIAQKQGSVSE